jgi:hypothetical protein
MANSYKVSALLLCFNRYHNYTVEELAVINEGDRFSLPPHITAYGTAAYEEAVARRDEHLFQTARLVTCGLYVQIVLNDYVRTILNLQRVESSWNLDPRVDVGKVLGTTNIDKATGNQVSVEFNLIYRWHSAISIKGERWLNEHLLKICPGARIENLTMEQLRNGMRTFAVQTPADPGYRTFGSLSRDARGYFNDSDLVRILTEATEDVAASFGPRHVPIALKVIEVMGIQQARAWGVASLNETRAFFGMVPHRTFSDINSDPGMSSCLSMICGLLVQI